MRGKDAPRIINASVWSAAVIGALAFSVSLGAYFWGVMDRKVTADVAGGETTQAPCPAGETPVAIHNYPGGDFLIGGTHSSYYLSESDKNFRCSFVCISTDTNKTVAQRVEAKLEGATIGGETAITFSNGYAFSDYISKADDVQRAKQRAMTAGVILNAVRPVTYNLQTKRWEGCNGPNSVRYGEIKTAEQTIEQLPERPSDEETKYQEPATTNKDTTTGADRIAGAPQPYGAPVGGDSTEDTSEGTSISQKISNCRDLLVQFNSDNNLRKFSPKFNTQVNKLLYELTYKIKFEEDGFGYNETTLNTCRVIAQYYYDSIQDEIGVENARNYFGGAFNKILSGSNSNTRGIIKVAADRIKNEYKNDLRKNLLLSDFKKSLKNAEKTPTQSFYSQIKQTLKKALSYPATLMKNFSARLRDTLRK